MRLFTQRSGQNATRIFPTVLQFAVIALRPVPSVDPVVAPKRPSAPAPTPIIRMADDSNEWLLSGSIDRGFLRKQVTVPVFLNFNMDFNPA
ncbi:hypothetical protein BX600DRAFT_507739 [Xylariales sp. PMI_506]|nr:hypothetical protein BX600DRAFT_507739 [Xylariales sp. PMI_506]